MKHFDVRSTLIKQTIKVVANEGFDKTTTKAIVGDTGINEAYIYKFFKDKDDLLTATFSALDEELCSKTLYYVSVMNMPDMDFEMRCQFFFTAIWQFLLGNRDKCITYVRYYIIRVGFKYKLPVVTPNCQGARSHKLCVRWSKTDWYYHTG